NVERANRRRIDPKGGARSRRSGWLERGDWRELCRDDRRRARLGLPWCHAEQLRTREHTERRGANPCPSAQNQRKEPERRPQRGSSAGKMCRVLSHRVGPPPRWSETARAAASIAMTLPTTSRGTERHPSPQP